jgi:ABC-type transport system substrate-binding protein
MTVARHKHIGPLCGIALLALAAGGASSAPVLPRQPGDAARYGGTFRVKGYQTPFNRIFDPAVRSHYFVTEQLYDGLVRFDNRFNPIPALAEYWTDSSGGDSITFRLRRGVRFHNGRELTADDVKYSLERLVQRRPGNATYQHFVGKVVGAGDYWEGRAVEVTGFRAVDRYTFEIRWVRPYVAGLYLLGMYYCKILPKDLLESQGHGFFNKPVGTGPFKFEEWIRSPRLEILGVRLERNPDYFERRPYLAAVEYSPYFTEAQFEEGDVHLVSVTSGRLSRGAYPVLENNTLKSYFLAFSCDMPPLDRAEVRRALALGLDKAKLAAAADTPATLHQVVESYVPPLLPGFYPKAASPYTDPDTAKLLLDRLLPDGGRKALKLTLLCDGPRDDENSGFARELERQLGALEIRLDVRYLRRPEDGRAVNTPYLKFFAYTMDFPDPEDIILPLFYSGSTANALSARFDDPRLDGLLERAASETSWERRTGLFQEMEKLLADATPAVPLFSERIRIALRPEVRGAELPAMGFIFLNVKDIWLAGEGNR